MNPIERAYLLIRLLRLTFWQRFYIRKNCLTHETQTKYWEQQSTSVCTEFRCASSWHSHLIRSAIFGFFYQGTLKSLNNHKTHKIHAHKIQNVFFLRSAKRRRQRRHTHKGLGDPKIDEHSRKSFILVQQMSSCRFNVIFFEIIKYAYEHIPCVDIYERDILLIRLPVDIY